jgi:hypothetical protein
MKSFNEAMRYYNNLNHCSCSKAAKNGKGCHICNPQEWIHTKINEGSTYEFDIWQYRPINPPEGYEKHLSKEILPEEWFEI